MLFPASAQIPAPVALRELDERLGTQTEEAYLAGCLTAPHLGGLAVRLSEGAVEFRQSKTGLTDSYIQLNSTAHFYEDSMVNGSLEERFGDYADLLKLKGMELTSRELVVCYLLHEMGHADIFYDYIQKASGDAMKGYIAYGLDRIKQVKTLPLRMITSYAIEYWDKNKGGYQDRLRSQGIDDEHWEELIRQNIQAYKKMPDERRADDFALSVLSAVS